MDIGGHRIQNHLQQVHPYVFKEIRDYTFPDIEEVCRIELSCDFKLYVDVFYVNPMNKNGMSTTHYVISLQSISSVMVGLSSVMVGNSV